MRRVANELVESIEAEPGSTPCVSDTHSHEPLTPKARLQVNHAGEFLEHDKSTTPDGGNHAVVRSSGALPVHGMPQARLRQVVEFIESSLARNFSSEDIAGDRGHEPMAFWQAVQEGHWAVCPSVRSIASHGKSQSAPRRP
jgi:hypothetical protein